MTKKTFLSTHKNHRGCLLVMIAPSGAGKTSLVRALLQEDHYARLSISYTTRTPRSGEINGKDYFFVTPEIFHSLREADAFLEWALVHGNYYGTGRSWVAEQLEAGFDIVLEIDWQGAVQVQKQYVEAITVFIAPPSIDILRERLVRRGQDSPETIIKRVDAATLELKQAYRFQYVIVNQNFDTALKELQTILAAARMLYARQCARYPEVLSLSLLESQRKTVLG